MKIQVSIAILLAICAQVSAQQQVDPTRPAPQQLSTPQSQMVASSTIRLEAIFSTGISKYAIINGQTVSQGQTIAGFTLVAISQNRIVMSDNDTRQEFFVNNTNFKKDTNHGF